MYNFALNLDAFWQSNTVNNQKFDYEYKTPPPNVDACGIYRFCCISLSRRVG